MIKVDSGSLDNLRHVPDYVRIKVGVATRNINFYIKFVSRSELYREWLSSLHVLLGNYINGLH